MTDVRRINHLFAILARKAQEQKTGDVWAEFIREYAPTKSEEVQLKALYEEYFVVC